MTESPAQAQGARRARAAEADDSYPIWLKLLIIVGGAAALWAPIIALVVWFLHR